MATPAPKLNILVSGAGIAGPALAYFLGVKAGHRITLVEKLSQLNTKGQNIDVRGPGQEVLKMMGLEKRVREMTTTEEGLVFESSDGAVQATLKAAAEGSGGGSAFTSDMEILRGDMATVLYQATKDYENVKYIFGDRITRVEEANNRVQVDFASGCSGQQYDLLVGADGQGSSVRELVFGGVPGCSRKDITRHTGMYMAYFTVPRQDDDIRYARMCMAPGRRMLAIRPDPHGTARAMLSVIPKTPSLQSEFDSALSLSTDAQRSVLHKAFKDAGWQSTRLLSALGGADDFYMQSIVQIMMPRWSSPAGRVVLLGDAGYTPSPLTGMGTTLALCAAYILGGEIAASPNDLERALKEYETKLRPVVGRQQKLFPKALHFFFPETRFGVGVFNWVIWALSKSGIVDLAYRLSQRKGEELFQLPKYRWKAED